MGYQNRRRRIAAAQNTGQEADGNFMQSSGSAGEDGAVIPPAPDAEVGTVENAEAPPAPDPIPPAYAGGNIKKKSSRG